MKPEDLNEANSDFKKAFHNMCELAFSQHLTIGAIIQKIRAIEDKNNQSITFTINEDGSGCFEDFWSEIPVVSFQNLEELQSVLITEQ